MLKHLHRFTSAALSAALLLASGNALAEDLAVSSTTLGSTEHTDLFWTVFSDSYEIPLNSVLTYTFKNYGGDKSHENFVVVAATDGDRSNTSAYSEYFALRPDNWGWGLGTPAGANGFNYTNGNFFYDTFINDMKEADVTVSVLNYNSVIYVSVTATSETGLDLKEEYNWAGSTINGSIYSFLTLEKSHITNLKVTRQTLAEAFSAVANVPIYMAKDQTTFTMPTRGVTAKVGETRLPFGTATLGAITTDGKVTATLGTQTADAQFEFVKNCTVYGNTDLTSAYGKVTEKVKVETGTPYTITYQVRSNGAANWSNVNVVLTNSADDATSTWLCRADNAACITLTAGADASWVGDNSVTDEKVTKVVRTSNWDWNVFAASIDGSVCTVTVTNNGDGTATVRYDIIDANGVKRFQTFSNLTVTADDLYVYHTLEKSYMLVPGAAEEDPGTDPSALKNVEQADVQIAVVGGNIVVSGADSFSVYNLQGRKVAAEGLASGIYVVRAGNVAKRVVIK